MAKEAFPRLPSGLVDFRCYIEYSPDPPAVVPATLPKKYDTKKWKDHHGYFKYDTWAQLGLEEGERNDDLKDFRAYPYNRFVMRPWEEFRLHREFEDDVVPPSDEIIRQVIGDFHELDIVSAAEIGIRAVYEPGISLKFGNDKPPVASRALDPADRIDLFRERQAQALQYLDETAIIQEILISSVLQRTARLLGSKALMAIAEPRVQLESEILPIRAKKASDLYYLSNALLTEMCVIEGIRIPAAA